MQNPLRKTARKTALVTGAACRVGREIALTLARAGMDVAITYLSSSEAAEQTVTDIRALGVESFAVALDVRSEANVKAAVGAVLERFGRLNVLVNNAAVFESVPLAEITLAQWDAVFETNARGPFLVAREALPALKAAKGHIVNLGSLGGSHAWATHGHYCASKAALEMLTKVMAKAFAPEVSVNCVAPGFIAFEGDTQAAHFAAKTPMQRNGSADDVAEAVRFFATGPHFITGQVLQIDGGLGL